MQADTGDLTELVRQVSILTGRVTVLTTRVTALGKQVRGAGERIEDATTAAAVLRNAGVPEHEVLARTSGRKGRHARDRHGLRGIDGGKR